jgi:hypothetical protein
VGSIADLVRAGASQVLDGSEGSFAVLASTERPDAFVQWAKLGGGIQVEVAGLDSDPDGRLAELGFGSGDPNFEQFIPDGDVDPARLTELAVSGLSAALGASDLDASQVNLQVEAV